MGSGEAQITTFMDPTMGDFAGTDLTPSRTFAPVYSGGSSGVDETDIVYVASDLPGNLAGITMCDSATSNRRCNQNYIYFDAAIPSYPVICHETGHAIGFHHGQWAAEGTIGGDPNDPYYW